MATDYEKAVDSLHKDFRDLRADFKTVLSAVRERAKERMSDTRDTVGDAADHKAQKFRRTAWRLRHRGIERMEDIKARVEHRPLTYVAAAVGIGMLVGSLLRRRRH